MVDTAASPVKVPLRLLLFWTPRVLTILFALFISIFALDVFGEGQGFFGTIIALLMHLIPTALILLFLVLAWRREWLGAVAYTALSFLYVATFWGRVHWSAYAAISGPLLLIALLFFLGWFYRARLRGAA